MRRKGISLLLALAAVGVLVAGVALHSRNRYVTFAGHRLEVPKGWEVQSEAAAPTTLSLMSTTGSSEMLPGSLDLIDRRAKPVDSAKFVDSWKSMVGTKYFHPLSVDQYRDAVVDQSHLQCIVIRWKPPIPLHIQCVTGDGLWKITLMGNDPDIGGFDQLAQQISKLEGK